MRVFALAGLAALSACANQTGVRELERTLSAQHSATAALTDYCAAHRLADPPVIKAAPAEGPPLAADARTRRLLAVESGETLGYRHVRLSCGQRLMSVAHNWYVRTRLSPAMNATLDSTGTPFGKVIAPLRFTRHPLGSTRGRVAGCPADTVLANRALLRLPDGQPVSLVLECYVREGLAR